MEIFNVRGLESVQIPLYNICYQKYKNQFDYISFLDFDEFITLNDNNLNNINDYVYNEKFEKCETIYLNWRNFGDSDIVKYDSRPVTKKFNKNFIIDDLGKSIVSTDLSNLLIMTVHLIGTNRNNFCNSNGEKIHHLYGIFRFKAPTNPKAYISHYMTKSAEEFCIKFERGYGHLNKNSPSYKERNNKRIVGFFSINKITKEKIDIIENCTGTNLDIYREKIKGW